MERKIWFITGISSGLGKALAETVMQQGDYVIGTLRKEAQVAAFNLENEGNGHALLLDVTDHQSAIKILSGIERIDVLVNNAGVGFIGAVEETSMEETRKVFEANFFSALHITQKISAKMREHGSGHIFQISSHSGFKAFAGFGIYGASKFALEGFSEAMAQELAPLGIKTTIVEPGPFRTNFASSSLWEAKQVIADYDATAGAFREKLKSVVGKQEGDPLKAAQAIWEHAQKENPSLRLPLGKIPMTTMQLKLDSVKADLEANRGVAEAAIFKS